MEGEAAVLDFQDQPRVWKQTVAGEHFSERQRGPEEGAARETHSGKIIHHFSTKQRRIRAIKEMARVLVPGGRLMIYVWAMEQKNRHFEKQDVLVPWNRAFCAQPFPESSQPGRRRLCGHGESSRPYPAACSECSCAVCYKEPCASRRSHSVDCEPVMARTCCANISKEGEEENGFYNSLGKSFRSWFSSRSLDESTLRKQIEKVRPLRNTDGRAEGTVSVQPCRRSSFDFNHREPFCTRQQSLDEEVFVETPSPKHLEWPGAGTGNCPQGLAPVWHGGIFTKRWNGAVRRNGGGDFLESAHPNENCVRAGELEEGTPSSTGRILRRIPALESADSNPDHAASVQAQQPDLSDPGAFMRYYHVFREGELSRLLAENVSELRILSAGNDHGNWCIIAEKRESCD
ncbi:probable tRNA methyltransferase 9B isoform X3 [Lepus europaeus]|uniref:probable tRNA methyltransferase 9B isoform X3 n=1 Tax=Lepus europaeus TaxID=9983 RepID=UPI002B464B47|nr:probable tRNA methyltransferase 9B isoform X3 [Lepus europaeus]